MSTFPKPAALRTIRLAKNASRVLRVRTGKCAEATGNARVPETAPAKALANATPDIKGWFAIHAPLTIIRSFPKIPKNWRTRLTPPNAKDVISAAR